MAGRSPWSTVGTREELRNDFRDWHADVQLMIDQIETPYKWAMMIREPWRPGRRVASPCSVMRAIRRCRSWARGVMSIEDGYVVAACLDKYFGEPGAAFARYEDIRRERTSMVVRKASENKASAFAPNSADKDRIADEVAREVAADPPAGADGLAVEPRRHRDRDLIAVMPAPGVHAWGR